VRSSDSREVELADPAGLELGDEEVATLERSAENSS